MNRTNKWRLHFLSEIIGASLKSKKEKKKTIMRLKLGGKNLANQTKPTPEQIQRGGGAFCWIDPSDLASDPYKGKLSNNSSPPSTFPGMIVFMYVQSHCETVNE